MSLRGFGGGMGRRAVIDLRDPSIKWEPVEMDGSIRFTVKRQAPGQLSPVTITSAWLNGVAARCAEMDEPPRLVTGRPPATYPCPGCAARLAIPDRAVHVHCRATDAYYRVEPDGEGGVGIKGVGR